MVGKWLEKLKDPKTKVRFWLYIGWIVVFILFLVPVMFAASSNPIFCGMCHENKPAIDAWKRSTHAEVTCYGCHAEYGLFNLVKDKLTAGLPSGVMKITGNYPIPINGESELAEEMAEHVELTCLKNCHSAEALGSRTITPSKALDTSQVAKESHKKHMEKEIGCTICHNRVAHPDPEGYIGKEEARKEIEEKLEEVIDSYEKSGITFTADDAFALPWDKGVGGPVLAYPNHMDMRFCMKCHTGGKGEKEGPRDCNVCHPKNFKLKPASHNVSNFLRASSPDRGVHTKMARVDRALSLRYCEACHLKKFCIDCHGLEVPHPEKDFVGGKNEHAALGQKSPKVCQNCHPQPNFCTACHHKDWKPEKGPWVSKVPGQSQHAPIVKEKGARPCFDCHNPLDCSHCHVTGEFVKHKR